MDSIYRHDLPALRASIRKLGAIVAEVDTDLRYVWIDNPHPDFDAGSVAGRRDDELIPAAEAAPIMDFKRDALHQRKPLGRTLHFRRSDGERAYTMVAYPIVDQSGRFEALLTVAFDTRSG